MAWSLMNAMIADKVTALLDENDTYPADEPRALARDRALAVIHAAIWAYTSRESSTAGAYANLNLLEALGLQAWSFDAEEAAAIRRMRIARHQKPEGTT